MTDRQTKRDQLISDLFAITAWEDRFECYDDAEMIERRRQIKAELGWS